MPSRLRDLIAAADAAGRPLLVVLAGSNGVGKSTFHAEALSGTGYPFVNADNIARDLSVWSGRPIGELAYEAMHRADALRRNLVEQRVSFIMETVLSDSQGAKLTFLSEARAAGYFLLFILITLEDVEMSIARVTQRVLNGGHDVPDEKLLARFGRTQKNAVKALAMADAGLVFDNSDPGSPFRWVETWEAGRCVSRAEGGE
jgi:predicted ABC-type ATPase